MSIVLIRLGDLSCIVVHFSVSFGFCMFSTLDERLAGNTTLVISFMSKGFPYKDQIVILLNNNKFYCSGFVLRILNMVPFSAFSFISIFNCNLLFEGTM